MRDVVVFVIFITLLPSCFIRPWTGILVFSWFAYMRTQDLTWGFVRTLPLSQSVAIAMILGWLVWERRAVFRKDPRYFAILFIVFWVGVSIAMNTVRWEVQGWRYQDFIKVVFVAFLTGALMNTRERTREILLVICGSFAFYGVKNGLYGAMGGQSITGPGGMLADNNDFAMAMVMNLPFLWYLAEDEKKRTRYGVLVFWGMRLAFVLTLFTIASTGSRGGFLTLVGVAFIMAMKTKYKVPALLAGLMAGVIGLSLAPDEYRERLASILTRHDSSTLGRLTAWKVSINMATANPIVGIGYQNTVYEYLRYLQGVEILEKDFTTHVAHNSYLQVWAETGTPTLIAFLFMLASTQWLLWRIIRHARRTGQRWAELYGSAIQVSLFGYMGGAMFLNRAHFDLVYQLIAISVALPAVMARDARSPRRTAFAGGMASTMSVGSRNPFKSVPAR